MSVPLVAFGAPNSMELLPRHPTALAQSFVLEEVVVVECRKGGHQKFLKKQTGKMVAQRDCQAWFFSEWKEDLRLKASHDT